MSSSEPTVALLSAEGLEINNSTTESIGAKLQWFFCSLDLNGSECLRETFSFGLKLIEEWFFGYEKYTTWGLTARILKKFIEIIKEVTMFKIYLLEVNNK